MRPFVIIFLFVVSSDFAYGQEADARKEHFNIKKNVALEGYDPVSYFEGAPKEGKSNINLLYKGISYQFASQANRTKFNAMPAKYEPAYGGWCAYAMGASGEKVKIDPETYKILDGKLYLFYNFWGSNTLKEWEKDEKKLKDAGDRNWKKIVH